jgi:UDP-N-acetylglucosamine--N-acetylmuramyl-(pentapeptide) pyrophosphoryl-undecaprenol N-acetylglucosamine transferase
MKILLVGGGSGGPVTPLLAVAEEIKNTHPKAEFLLVGTKKGPETEMAERAKIAFLTIPAGKLRRYFSLRNIAAPFLVLAGFFKAFTILRKFKPDCIFGAGSFVQVPVVWAAWFFKVPVVLHQQDLHPSLANTICQMAAKKITVTFEDSVTDFWSGTGILYKHNKEDKVIFTGNPFRKNLLNFTREQGQKEFNLVSDLPVLLVLGGGTGAEFLNELIEKSLPALTKSVQIIHSTGHNKSTLEASKNYHPFEFISNMGEAYAAADIVLCRAGLSTITELSNLEKLSIIVPMPKSHQELNGYMLAKLDAAIVVTQERLNSIILTELVRKLLFEHKLQQELKKNISKIMPKNSVTKISEIIVDQIIKK